MRLNTIFLPTDHCTLTCSDPVGPLLTLALSPLDATLVNLPASVTNKRFTSQLNPLDATLTKTRGGGAAAEFLKQNFHCMEIPAESRQPSSLQTTWRAALIPGSALTTSSLTTDNCGLTMTSKTSRPVAVVGGGGDAHAAKLVLVILLVEDVPLLAAFEDFLFLRSDSLADFQFDLFFFFQRGGQNLHHLLANGVAVVDEFHFCAFDKHVRDLVREPYDFFAGKAHLPFPCLNIARPNPGSSHPGDLPISIFKFLSQDQLAVPRQLLLHLFVHLLIRDAGPAHFVLVIDQNLPYFLVEPVFDRQFLQHPQADTVGHRRNSLGFDLPAFDQPFHNFIGHVRYKIPYEKHLCAFPLHQCKRVSLLAAVTKCKEGSEIVQIFSSFRTQLYPEPSRIARECRRPNSDKNATLKNHSPARTSAFTGARQESDGSCGPVF